MAKKSPKRISIEPIERTTRRPWAEWLAFMDRIGATDLNHSQIAEKVNEELESVESGIDNPGWWAQGITVAYEQHSGRRLPGQQADGTFQTSVSRTTNMGVQVAMDTWVRFAADDAEVQRLVASPAKTSGSDKRKTWRTKAADGSALLVTSELRPNGKTAVIAQQLKLPSPEANVEAKERWAAVLERFLETTG